MLRFKFKQSQAIQKEKRERGRERDPLLALLLLCVSGSRSCCVMLRQKEVAVRPKLEWVLQKRPLLSCMSICSQYLHRPEPRRGSYVDIPEERLHMCCALVWFVSVRNRLVMLLMTSSTVWLLLMFRCGALLRGTEWFAVSVRCLKSAVKALRSFWP